MLLYIDDRLKGEFQSTGIQESGVSAARRSLHVSDSCKIRLFLKFG